MGVTTGPPSSHLQPSGSETSAPSHVQPVCSGTIEVSFTKVAPNDATRFEASWVQPSRHATASKTRNVVRCGRQFIAVALSQRDFRAIRVQEIGIQEVEPQYILERVVASRLADLAPFPAGARDRSEDESDEDRRTHEEDVRPHVG